MTQLFIVLGALVLGLALRSFAHPMVRKAGAVAVLVASYLAAYYLIGSHWAGLGAILAWFLLPWVELLTRIRKLRLPLRKSLEHQTPPSSQRFPHLNEFTDEIETLGFEYVEDAGWEWDDLQQFFRIFYHADEKTQASICLNEQHGMAFTFVSLTSRTGDGRIFRTWNFPFSYTLKMAPEIEINRVADAESFEALLVSHRAFVGDQTGTAGDLIEESPETLPGQMEDETQIQIRHNLDRGLIETDHEDPERVRYSWRGLFFLYGQLIKDMVKLG